MPSVVRASVGPSTVSVRSAWVAASRSRKCCEAGIATRGPSVPMPVAKPPTDADQRSAPSRTPTAVCSRGWRAAVSRPSSGYVLPVTNSAPSGVAWTWFG